MMLDKIKNIKFWKTGDVRAPHKPLLVFDAEDKIINISYR